MATHGFIEFKFEEETRQDRTLVHAVHDGYFDDMLEDILTIAFYIAYDLKKESIIQEEVPQFLKSDNRNKRRYLYEMYSDDNAKSFEQLGRRWESSIPLDDTRITLPSYLIAKRPDKYQIEKEPFNLYGGVVDKADIVVNFVNRRLNTLKITFNHEFDEDDEKYYLELINQINNYLTEDKAKIKVLNDGNLIIMNVDLMIVDLFYHKKI
jgi:hypothetical protein